MVVLVDERGLSMVEKKVSVKNEHGLHARPAALFVQKASSYPFAISVEKEGKSANAKSIISVMTLTVKQGDEVILKSEGENAQEALDALEQILIGVEA